jgi:hypothetical protein
MKVALEGKVRESRGTAKVSESDPLHVKRVKTLV